MPGDSEISEDNQYVKSLYLPGDSELSEDNHKSLYLPGDSELSEDNQYEKVFTDKTAD